MYAAYLYRRRREISIHALRVEGDRTSRSAALPAPHFYPRPPGGGRPFAFFDHPKIITHFYPRPPGGGRPWHGRLKVCGSGISIHALRVEGDPPCIRLLFLLWRYFYPRPPGGGRQKILYHRQCTGSHFYPRPPGGGRQQNGGNQNDKLHISIHALRVEGDISGAAVGSRRSNFYPRPPGGGRRCPKVPAHLRAAFLSTPSGWRATDIDG